ncbi:MAG: NADH-ubiquinone oxidoreductase-F iron-sulfur binding region domain-containing protein [Parcubacteria group bacterium]|jgi:NADH:ubiquinone oxidoreductase subunit F (NADH-binding)
MQILTKNWDKIDPFHIDTYARSGGYEALRKVIREMTPESVVKEIKISGLQGRGGAGCPTALKWESAAKTKAQDKYFICNLDESEPGVYKDRTIAEKSPHQIIEGMIIGAYAIGAKKGFIYINGHYEKSAEILTVAIKQALEKEFLGKGIMGSSFDFEIEIFRGSGAYICGEETALINTIEGKRGEPRLKPPYPVNSGLFGKPTVVNNTETLVNIPFIISRGAKIFSGIGMKNSPGTKLFLLEGAVKSKGIFEAPLGTSVQELIYNSIYGGGLEEGKEFWFAQIGGASGRLMTAGNLDQLLVYGPAEYPLGCGSILVVDKSMDLKDFLVSWSGFFHRESCGKCVPCREGTFRLHEIAKRIRNNDLLPDDQERLEDILWTLGNTTFCPLGNFAATAWKDAIRIFGDKIFKAA